MASYEGVLSEIIAKVNPQPVTAEGGTALIREQLDALMSTVNAERREAAIIRERALCLAADALGVISCMREDGELGPAFVNPTLDRLPGMIDEFAPNTAGARIGDNDPTRRFAEEVAQAARQYLQADPRSLHGSPTARAGALFRVVGLVAHALASPSRTTSQ
ncbi:MAG: hypothetical protein ACRDK7_06600 [Solirubrobacteraceae bacterium]